MRNGRGDPGVSWHGARNARLPVPGVRGHNGDVAGEPARSRPLVAAAGPAAAPVVAGVVDRLGEAEVVVLRCEGLARAARVFGPDLARGAADELARRLGSVTGATVVGTGQALVVLAGPPGSGEMVRRVAALPVSVCGLSLAVEARIGFALAPADGTTPEALLSRAGDAARRAPPGGPPLRYDPITERVRSRRLQIARELAARLAEDSLTFTHRPYRDRRGARWCVELVPGLEGAGDVRESVLVARASGAGQVYARAAVAAARAAAVGGERPMVVLPAGAVRELGPAHLGRLVTTGGPVPLVRVVLSAEDDPVLTTSVVREAGLVPVVDVDGRGVDVDLAAHLSVGGLWLRAPAATDGAGHAVVRALAHLASETGAALLVGDADAGTVGSLFAEGATAVAARDGT